MLCQNPARKISIFAKRNSFKAAGPFKAKIKTAYACEKRKDAQLGHSA
jgi:hypothetical protein